MYVTARKQTIIQNARTELKSRLGGDAAIGDMEVDFFHHFPNITLHLSKVALRDSLWQQHHHDLVDAQNVYLNVAVMRSIFAAKLRLGKVYIEGGSIYLFTDSTGYSNTSVLPRKKPGGQAEDMHLPDIFLSDTRVVVEMQDRHKLFDLELHKVECKVDEDGRALSLRTRVDALVKSFAFNTEKGSFLKDKRLSGRFTLQYNTGSKIFQFNKITLQIDGHPFVLSGRFFPDVKPDPFVLSIHADNIPYRKATGLLTPLIQQKLDLYDIDKPVNVQADLDAGAADDPTPLITVAMNLQDVSINTPTGRFDGVRAVAKFTNEWVRHEKRRDENSAVRLMSFTGSFLGLPLRSDSAVITNLKQPVIHCDLHSSFELTRLNELTGSKSFQFQRGLCGLNVIYTGPMTKNDSAGVSIYGDMSIDSATIRYLPNDFELTDGVGKIRFRDQDVVLDKLEARTGSSRVNLKGTMKNIAPLIDRQPNNVNIDLQLSSSKLDLEDLSSLLGKPTTQATPRKGTGPVFGRTASRLDALLRDVVIHLQIDAAEVRYQKFMGARAKADVLFQGNEVRLKKMELTQDAGSVSLSGMVTRHPEGGGNPISFQSHIERVDLPRLFTAFDNFGQEGLQDKNLKGKLTADVEMTGRLTDKAKIIRNSLKGRVDFTVKGGQLIDFEPMQKIHETVLKKRDLSEIHFAELKNQLELDTTTLTIHRMEIQSTAFTLFVEGTYDLKAGPDLSLQVPLSNLKKDRNTEIPPDSKGNDGKAGLSLRLRARRGDDGKMKISWDPFKKALKKKK